MRYRGHRRRRGHRPRQKVSWFPMRKFLTTSSFPSQGSTLTQIIDQQVLSHVEHEAVLERTRGSIFGVASTTGSVFQVTFAGLILPAEITSMIDADDLPNLDDSAEGDDYFVYETFACIDTATTNTWNGRTIDSRAKRRVERGSGILWFLRAELVVFNVSAPTLSFGMNLRSLLKFN